MISGSAVAPVPALVYPTFTGVPVALVPTSVVGTAMVDVELFSPDDFSLSVVQAGATAITIDAREQRPRRSDDAASFPGLDDT